MSLRTYETTEQGEHHGGNFSILQSIYKFKKARDCLWASQPVWVSCLWIRWKFVSSQLRAASFTYFGEVFRCPHKRIVTITKVYIASNNIHVEIIRFRKNTDFNYILKFQLEKFFHEKCPHC